MGKKSWVILFVIVSLATLALIHKDNFNTYFIRDDTVLIHGLYDKGPRFFAQLFVNDYVKYIWPWGPQDVWDGKGKGFIRPLLMISFRLDHLLYGTHPLGYHVTNVLLHFINGLLVFLIVRFFTREGPLSFAAGLLFTVNPAHSEAVAWLSGRSESVAAIFYLASFYFFIRYRDGRRRTYYLLSLVFFLLSLFAKETPAVFPFLLVAYDALQSYWQRPNAAPLLGYVRENIRKYAYSWAPYFGILAGWFLMRKITLGAFIGAYGGHMQVNLKAKLLAMLSCVRHALLASPFNHLDTEQYANVMGLGALQPQEPLHRFEIGIGGFYVALLLLPVLFVGARQLRYGRLLAVGALWLCFTYPPVFFNLYIAAFYLYLIIPGLCFIVTACLFSLYGKKVALAISLVLCLAYAGYQHQYTADWVHGGRLSRQIIQAITEHAENFAEDDTVVLMDLPTNYKTAWVFEAFPEAALRKPLASSHLTDRFYIKVVSTETLRRMITPEAKDQIKMVLMENTDIPLLKFEEVRGLVKQEGKGLMVSVKDLQEKITAMKQQRPSRNLHILRWDAKSERLIKLASLDEIFNEIT